MFSKKRANKDGSTIWRCEQTDSDKCRVCVKTEVAAGVVRFMTPEHVGDHTHMPRPEHVLREEARASVRNRASTQEAEQVCTVVASELQGFNEQQAPTAPSARSLKQAAWRQRSSDSSKKLKLSEEAAAATQLGMCTTLADLDLPQQLVDFKTRTTSETFLMHDSGPETGERRFLIFGLQRNIDMLKQSHVWLSDGTFSQAPALFKQLYTVHAYDAGYVMPCAFALLPRKDKPQYRTFWKVLQQKTGLDQEDAAMPLLLTDFEQAAYKAAQEAMPGMEVGGCFFHFRQAIHKHVQMCGLISEYSASDAFRLRIATIACLAFLKPEHVPATFRKVAAEAESQEQQWLMEYIEETWVGSTMPGGRCKAPTFPLEMWSLHSRFSSGTLRTTNACERFHRQFAAFNAGAPHPSVPKFIGMLHKQQALTNIDMGQAMIGHEKAEKAVSSKRNMAITKLMRLYVDGKACPHTTAVNLAYHYLE